MKKIPKLAIVGRPNVGKSALFNRICKKKISIVDESEGVTRDRLYAEADFFGQPFQVIDTGGIDPRSKEQFNDEVKKQAELAIEEADSIVMVVDSRVGITELDQELARILLRTNKTLCLAVNKIDNRSQEILIHEFHPLGIERIIGISAIQNNNIAELLEICMDRIPEEETQEVEVKSINVAVVGRTNVGKSTLINIIMDEERCIVSPVPGTTRDSIDCTVQNENSIFTFIDTAGIRRKRAEKEAVDKFAAIRTRRAIERADVCLLMLDAQEGMTTQEKRIATMIEELGKGCIVLINKWDMVKGIQMEHCLRGIEEEVSFLNHCPKLILSALIGRNVDKIFPLIQEVYQNSFKKVSTPQVNKLIENAIQKNHPPMLKGKRLRIYYLTQTGVQPPQFVLFVNYPNLMLESYKKYLINQFRKTFPFKGVPVVFRLKGKTNNFDVRNCK